MRKKTKYRLEAMLVRAVLAGCRWLPLDTASRLGGRLARALGPLFPAHKVALQNLSMVFPAASPAEKRQLLADMWDNIGRVAAELPHLPGGELYARMEIAGKEHIPKPEQPVIFFSAHLGNWELTYPMAFHNGLPTTLIYRHANNPEVDALINAIRATQSSEQLSKGMKNGIKIISTIKNGHSLAMLVDQKMNNGIPVPFFGRDAMTAPAIAELALRYNLPIVPVRVLRTTGCHFQATIYPPLAITPSGDRQQDVLAIMTDINRILEDWIREAPGQWFWVHRRWPKESAENPEMAK